MFTHFVKMFVGSSAFTFAGKLKWKSSVHMFLLESCRTKETLVSFDGSQWFCCCCRWIRSVVMACPCRSYALAPTKSSRFPLSEIRQKQSKMFFFLVFFLSSFFFFLFSFCGFYLFHIEVNGRYTNQNVKKKTTNDETNRFSLSRSLDTQANSIFNQRDVIEIWIHWDTRVIILQSFILRINWQYFHWQTNACRSNISKLKYSPNLFVCWSIVYAKSRHTQYICVHQSPKMEYKIHMIYFNSIIVLVLCVWISRTVIIFIKVLFACRLCWIE